MKLSKKHGVALLIPLGALALASLLPVVALAEGQPGSPDCGCSWSSEPMSGDELSALPQLLPVAPTLALAAIVHVEQINVNWGYAGGMKKRPLARVRILDDLGAAVYGATVTANWSGCFKENGVSGVTGDLDIDGNGTIGPDETGWAVVSSTRTASCPSKQCYFILAVTNVSSPGNSYAPAQNVETTDFVRCNPFLP